MTANRPDSHTAVRDARLSAHLVGFKGPRLAERARLERLSFYPSMGADELYGQLRELQAARAAVAIQTTGRAVRKFAWLCALLADVQRALDVAAADEQDIRTWKGDVR
jgi:hypothetical protein